MERTRKGIIGASAAAALFSLSVALYTQNGALFLLAGLAAALAIGTAAKKSWR